MATADCRMGTGSCQSSICNRKSSIPCAGVAQLVEHYLAKVGVAGPNPVSRSSRVRSPDAERRSPAFVLCALSFVLS